MCLRLWIMFMDNVYGTNAIIGAVSGIVVYEIYRMIMWD